MNFLVTVELPKSKDPLEIESLVTDMPIFSQALLTKSEAVSFESLHLNGAFAQIYALVRPFAPLTCGVLGPEVNAGRRRKKCYRSQFQRRDRGQLQGVQFGCPPNRECSHRRLPRA